MSGIKFFAVLSAVVLLSGCYRHYPYGGNPNYNYRGDYYHGDHHRDDHLPGHYRRGWH